MSVSDLIPSCPSRIRKKISTKWSVEIWDIAIATEIVVSMTFNFKILWIATSQYVPYHMDCCTHSLWIHTSNRTLKHTAN